MASGPAPIEDASAIPDALIDRLSQARRIVVFTGAGVSAESGIATFRDRNTGLWERFDAHELATPSAFVREPALVWGWYEWRRAAIARAQPNPAHRAIAQLANSVAEVCVVTQNVDNLHERAGSKQVVHLHGNLAQARCIRCGRAHKHAVQAPDEPENGRAVEPPRCRHCNSLVRPGVVWFGESLPEDAWQLAADMAASCDVLLSVGTSALVYPAASLPRSAAARGAMVIQVNPMATDMDRLAHFNLRGAAGVMLPAVVANLENRVRGAA